MWSAHRKRVAPSEITLRQSSSRRSKQVSPEPQLVTLDSDSNESTFPYGFGHQNPIVPPSLNHLNLPPNPINVLATIAVIRQDEEESPQSPEPSDPSKITAPL